MEAALTHRSMVVRMLQYTLTISLTFPVLLSLFAASLGAAFFVIRYRYLARYNDLKEPALPPPSPPSLSNDLSGIASSGLGLLNDTRRSTTFHNYLDDFLAAIRIFGYLEKPMFHELSRHLQTRRLAAGETLEIGGGEFWSVVEGRVQVVSVPETYRSMADLQFAPSSSSGGIGTDAQDVFGDSHESCFNGYHLLNEVSTGGTLSSLFSILSLFTEDIKVSWTPPAQASETEQAEYTESLATGSDPELARSVSRADSDVSQMDGEMGQRVQSPVTPMTARQGRPRSSSVGTESTAMRSGSRSPSQDEAGPAISPSLSKTTPSSPLSLHPAEFRNTHDSSPGSPTPSSRYKVPLPRQSSNRPSPLPSTARHQPHTQNSMSAMQGTIARATVDTTLAVIPAEAFRKLTKKFPKASGTVVQVVLERFSRVTFMTGKTSRVDYSTH